jgi:solute carrier family 39 (zinc transporter), member 1/2/3
MLNENARLLSLANCFAGGIFLMLSFGHLIPESIITLGQLSNDPNYGFRALMYVVIGFLTMLFVGKVAFQHTEDHTLSPETLQVIRQEKQQQHGKKNSLVVDITPSTLLQQRQTKPFSINSAMILCFAMSIHSFFESAALGLSSNISSAFLLSSCIALHQPAESLALVIAFLKTDMKKSNIILWLMAFSSVAFLGNITGNIINTSAPPSVEALIVAITAGTFIYVGAAEVK